MGHTVAKLLPRPIPEGVRPTYTRYLAGRFYAVYHLDTPPEWLVACVQHREACGARSLDDVFDLLDSPRAFCCACALNHDRGPARE